MPPIVKMETRKELREIEDDANYIHQLNGLTMPPHFGFQPLPASLPDSEVKTSPYRLARNLEWDLCCL